MTPFELALDNDLSTEARRFENEWLFRWYGLTYEGGKVEVDNFEGGRIHYGGIRFGQQQQQIFWHAISAYLKQQIHGTFKRWDDETRAYPVAMRKNSIDGVEMLLRRFAAQIVSKSLQTAGRVRGSELPAVAGPRIAPDYEIRRLAEANRVLCDQSTKAEPPPNRLVRLSKRIEGLYAAYAGWKLLAGSLIALASFVYSLWIFIFR